MISIVRVLADRAAQEVRMAYRLGLSEEEISRRYQRFEWLWAAALAEKEEAA